MKSIIEKMNFRHCVEERDEHGQRGMGKYISACKIQSGRSSTRFHPFLQSILDSVQNDRGRQGVIRDVSKESAIVMTRKIRIKVFSVSRILSSVSWQFFVC